MKLQKTFKHILLLKVFLDLLLLNAQDAKEHTYSVKDSSYFEAGIEYLNDAVFMGRKDTISNPYLSVEVEYNHKSGFFASMGMSYLTSSDESKVDLVTISAGYVFQTENVFGGFSATNYTFSDSSYNIKSELIGYLQGYLGYDFNFVDVSVDGNLFLNDKNSDFILGVNLSKIFYAANDDLEIWPMLSAYFGSQNYYNQYLISRKGKRQGQGSGSGNSSNQQSEMPDVRIDEVEAFKLLNIELSIPVFYNLNRFTFSFTPTLAYPQNLSEISVDETIFEEDLKPTIYFSIGVDYKF